jgi:hypothetical protein
MPDSQPMKSSDNTQLNQLTQPPHQQYGQDDSSIDSHLLMAEIIVAVYYSKV